MSKSDDLHAAFTALAGSAAGWARTAAGQAREGMRSGAADHRGGNQHIHRCDDADPGGSQ